MKLIHQWEGGLHKHDTQTHKHTNILGFYSSIDIGKCTNVSILYVGPTVSGPTGEGLPHRTLQHAYVQPTLPKFNPFGTEERELGQEN